MGFEDRTVICEKKELKRLIIFLRKVLVRFFIYIFTVNELQAVDGVQNKSYRNEIFQNFQKTPNISESIGCLLF